LHGYPFDYFRFSTEALAGCFGSKNGIAVMASDYDFPCCIESKETGASMSWLNVNLYGVKTSQAPDSFIYEFDTSL
jgi:hypothetical protein